MNKILLIRAWAGELPPYIQQVTQRLDLLTKYGIDYLIINDMKIINILIEQKLGIDNHRAEEKKMSDFYPAYGKIFEDVLKGYDFWGHINLDVVFGRMDHYLTDSFLSDCDILTDDDNGRISGPFTLYRNTPKINNLYSMCPNWCSLLSSPRQVIFDEIAFANFIEQNYIRLGIRLKVRHWQAHDNAITMPWHAEHPQLLLTEDGTLFDDCLRTELLFFHFNGTKVWPFFKTEKI